MSYFVFSFKSIKDDSLIGFFFVFEGKKNKDAIASLLSNYHISKLKMSLLKQNTHSENQVFIKLSKYIFSR